MASIARDKNGTRRILFIAPDGRRPTIRLGRVSQRDAETVARHIEALLASQIAGTPVPGPTAAWLGGIGAPLRRRLARVGLVEAAPPTPTLQVFLNDYIESRVDVRPLTRRNLQDAARWLCRSWGDRRLADITPGDVQDLQSELFARLAPNTARRILSRGKQFFAYAVRKEMVTRNPFTALRGLGVRPNRERDYYVDAEQSQRVLDALPTPAWRALFCLARFCGLRVPSEIVDLTWADVYWGDGRIVIHATKTARDGRGLRHVPLFPEARQALSELFDAAPEGVTYVFPDFRRRVRGAAGLKNANLRTQLMRYVMAAGLKPWPKLWSNLRRSCAIDLASRFPAFAAQEWLGHSQAVSETFYLRLTPRLEAEALEFRRLPGAAHNPAQQVHAQWCLERHTLGSPSPQGDM